MPQGPGARSDEHLARRTAPMSLTASMNLHGKVAVVTGAGRGLGRGIALALAESGADVALVSRTTRDLQSAADYIGELGRRAWTLRCDVTDSAGFERVLDEVGDVDILISNAGTNEPQPFLEVDAGAFDRLVDLNLRAAFFTAQVVARRMVRQGRRGAIVYVSSQMGHVGAPRRSVYCATKHAVEGLVKSMALELAPHSIRVNSVAPTYVATPMTKPFFEDAAFRAETEARIPLGRIGRVEDVASAVVFLASPAAALITGTSLLIDGGYTAQ
jgi:NAD(P)-dependent dehydrogenase (short-subunit alcohol dehydrogenase family)